MKAQQHTAPVGSRTVLSNTGASTRSVKAATLWFLLLFAVGFILYLPGVAGLRFEDDFAAYYDPLPTSPLYFLQNPAQYAFWRPLPGVLFLLTQQYFGHVTWPIHLINLMGHVLTGLILYWGMPRIGYSIRAARYGSMFFIVSQIGAFNVLGNDTTGQVWVVVFGCLALYCAHNRRYIISVISLALAFLCKETVLVFLPLMLITLSGFRSKLRRTDYAASIVCLALGALYMWVRSQVGAMNILAGHGSYGWGVGPHVLHNLAYAGFGLTVPGSTVDAFSAWETASNRIIAYGLASVLFIVILTIGLTSDSQSRKRHTAFAVLSLLALLPFAIMHHIGEGYLNIGLVFMSVLVGASFHNLHSLAAKARYGRSVVALLLILLIVSHTNAVRKKAELVRQNGQTAYRLIEELRPFAEEVPDNGSLILRHVRRADEMVYSVYHRPGFLLLDKNHMIPKLLGRPDITVTVIDEEAPGLGNSGETSILEVTDRGNGVTMVSQLTENN